MQSSVMGGAAVGYVTGTWRCYYKLLFIGREWWISLRSRSLELLLFTVT